MAENQTPTPNPELPSSDFPESDDFDLDTTQAANVTRPIQHVFGGKRVIFQKDGVDVSPQSTSDPHFKTKTTEKVAIQADSTDTEAQTQPELAESDAPLQPSNTDAPALSPDKPDADEIPPREDSSLKTSRVEIISQKVSLEKSFDPDSTERITQAELLKQAEQARLDDLKGSTEFTLPKPRSTRAERRQTKRDAKLLETYTDLRRQQYETLTKLLETLTRVDGMDEKHVQQVRDAIFHADHPFLLTLVGPFSSGKSSVINALLGEEILTVGPIPTTDHIAILRHGDSPQNTRSGTLSTVFHPADILRRISLVDTPGLESIFKRHDELTQSFLHRADIVILVMIATQVLSASDLTFMQNLKEYGKRLIIIVNQVDVLEPEERQQVYDFVREQSTLQLGIQPLIWLVSAKEALEACNYTPRNEHLWTASGFAEIEDYLEGTLDEVARIRQKLETPLSSARNATQAALSHVTSTQSTLVEHRKNVENIEAQIRASEQERLRLLDKTLADLDVAWQGAAKKGAEAIADMFQGSRAVGQSLAGCLEIVGLGRLIRRFSKQTQAQEAFTRHEVRESLQNIPHLADKLGPTLEGRDQEDVDRLVDYTRQQIQKLPQTLKDKIIGKVETPLSYERKPLRTVRNDLEEVLHQAGYFEPSRIDRVLRSTIVVMGLWLFIVVIIGVLMATGNILAGGGVINVVIILALALAGLAILPIRGWLLQRVHTARLDDLQSKYRKILERAAREQIEYGTQLRRDVTAPFTRLVGTQFELSNNLKNDLQAHEHSLINLQHNLSAMLKD